jgi:surface protein
MHYIIIFLLGIAGAFWAYKSGLYYPLLSIIPIWLSMSKRYGTDRNELSLAYAGGIFLAGVLFFMFDGVGQQQVYILTGGLTLIVVIFYIFKKTKEEPVIYCSNDNIHKIIYQEIEKYGKVANLNHLDVSGVTSMYKLFYTVNMKIDDYKKDDSREGQFNGDISEWDVSNVYNMKKMFSNSNVTYDISKWDVSNVREMEGMFEHGKVESDLNKWNVYNVIHMERIFLMTELKYCVNGWRVHPDCNIYYAFDRTSLVSWKGKKKIIKRFDFDKDHLEYCKFKKVDLYSAIFEDDLKLVKTLIEEGLNINRYGESGVTALWEAVYWHRDEIVKFLLECTANPNLKQLTHKEFSPLDLALARDYDTYKGIVEMLRAAGAKEGKYIE